MSILHLPNELIITIAETLCIHCSDQHALDNLHLATQEAALEKMTLSRLSRTCRRLHDISEPILYHYYSLNLMGNCEPIKFIFFVRSILSRPKLASLVRAVRLDEYGFEANQVSDVEFCLKQGEARFKFTYNRSWLKVRGQYLDYSDRISNGLHKIILAACSDSLTHVLFTLMSNEQAMNFRRDWEGICTLPRLQTLAFVGLEPYDYHLYEVNNIINLAPHLQVLLAADCGASCWLDVQDDFRCQANPEPVALSNLCKLSLNGLQEECWPWLLGHCGELEELELHFCTENIEVPPFSTFAASKQRLRRLVFSVSYSDICENLWWQDLDEQDIAGLTGADKWYFMSTGPREEYGNGIDLSDFESLEILEIDQISFIGEALEAAVKPEAAQDLSRRLPQSLRVLHIGFMVSWEHILPSLLGLAEEKGRGRFRDLKIVRVDPMFDSYEGRTIRIPEEELQFVQGAFDDAGVEFKVGLNPKGYRLRGMLAERPGGDDKRDICADLFYL